MRGAVELAEEIFNLPVRLGYPQRVTGYDDVAKNPEYATAVGLLHYGFQYEEERDEYSGIGVNSIFKRIKSWAGRYF